MTVMCKGCNKKIEIRPDGLGRITGNMIHWVVDLGEKCNDCRDATRKEAVKCQK